MLVKCILSEKLKKETMKKTEVNDRKTMTGNEGW